MEELLTKRISTEHSNAIIQWGVIAYQYETSTEIVKQILENYIQNVNQFNSFAEEIKYYLVLSLNEDMKSTIARSELIKRKQNKSPEEKELTEQRNKILARVNVLFRNLRFVMFPSFLNDDTPPKKTPSKPLIIESIIESDTADDCNTSVEDNTPTPVKTKRSIPEALEKTTVEPETPHRYTAVLGLITEFLIGTIGSGLVFTIIDDKESVITEYMANLEMTCVSIKYSPDMAFDVLFGIPDKKNQICVLTTAIDSKKPFVLYLDLSIIEVLPIDATECRLNLILSGRSGWFIGYFPVNIGGNGSGFQIKTILCVNTVI